MGISCILIGNVAQPSTRLTIRSLLKHGAEDCEVILSIPNAMVPAADALVAEFENDDRILVCVSQDASFETIAGLRAKGVASARCRHFAFFAPGDWVDETYFKYFLPAAAQSDAAFAIAGYGQYNARTHEVQKQEIVDHPSIIARSFSCGAVQDGESLSAIGALALPQTHLGKIYKTKALQPVEQNAGGDIRVYNDAPLHWLACASANEVLLLSFCGPYYMAPPTNEEPLQDKSNTHYDTVTSLEDICCALAVADNPHLWGLFQELVVRRANEIRRIDPDGARAQFSVFSELIAKMPVGGLSQVSLARSSWHSALAYVALRDNEQDAFMKAGEDATQSTKVALALKIISALGIRQFLGIWLGNKVWLMHPLRRQKHDPYVWIE